MRIILMLGDRDGGCQCAHDAKLLWIKVAAARTPRATEGAAREAAARTLQ
jgi:hypothetical protein